jgi:hypothetical protein
MVSTTNLDTQSALGQDLADGQIESPDLLDSRQHQLPTTDSRFPLFPKLPIELRLIVWEMALPGPRCLEVVQHIEKTGPPEYQASFGRHFGSRFKYCYWTATDKSPAMLFTSHEPRQVTLNHYQPFKHGPPSEAKRTSYIDPLRDTLFCTTIPASWDIDPIDPTTLERIAKAIPNLTRMAMDVHNISYWYHAIGKLRCFGQLKELLVVPQPTSGRDGRPHGGVFEDVGEQTWNDRELDDERMRRLNYAVVRRWEGFLRQTEGKSGRENEAWVAPRLRIGMFVQSE